MAEKLVTLLFVMMNAVTFSRALADPTRWRIIRLVSGEALCVCELADILSMPQSSVSSHVQIIRKAGLLESEKCEKWTYFRIDPKFMKLIRSMQSFFAETSDPDWENDFQCTAQRLAEREGSCCPGPKKLRSPEKSKQTAIA